MFLFLPKKEGRPIITEIIKRLMEVKGLNNKELSRKAHLSYFEIAIIRNHPKKLNIITLRKLADALDVPPKVLAKYII